jgi:hypothetical protein
MRDLIFHLIVLWLVLGALLVATSSLVSARDQRDAPINNADLDDDEQPTAIKHHNRYDASRSADISIRTDDAWRSGDDPIRDTDGPRLAF